MIKELDEKIISWARWRGLDKKGTVEGQAIKTAEEVAELIIGLSKDDKNKIIDSIGDVYVTLVVGNLIQGKGDFEKAFKRAEMDSKNTVRHYGAPDKAEQIINLMIATKEVLTLGYTTHTISLMLMDIMIVAGGNQLSFKNCVESAYQEIKGRKGRIIDGTFVKESDLIDD
ncbi:MAG: MazG-like family protein [Enterococcus faecium]|nr:MazG-like family protein [Enterococcus faecium]